jgi:hypothetical protein
MPRFFFDIQMGAISHQDQDGTDMPGPLEARVIALEALTSFAKDDRSDRDQRHWAADVRDETGRVIYRASLSLMGGWID